MATVKLVTKSLRQYRGACRLTALGLTALLAGCASVDGLLADSDERPPAPPAPPAATAAPSAAVPSPPRSLGRIGDLNPVQPLPPVEQRPSPLLLPGSGDASAGPAVASAGLPSGTFAGDKALQIESDLERLEAATRTHSGDHNRLQQDIVSAADRYRSTTAGLDASAVLANGSADPASVQRWHAAEAALAAVRGRVQQLEQLRSRIVADAALAGYLAEQAQAAGHLTGAVEADQRRLRGLEARSQRTQIALKDLLGAVDDDILRQSAYVTREQRDLARRTSGIKSDSLYGEAPEPKAGSPAGRPARQTAGTDDWTGLRQSERRRPAVVAPAREPPAAVRVAQPRSKAPQPQRPLTSAAPPPKPAAATESRQPLLDIAFPRDKVDYEAQLYAAISEAVAHNPSARFEVVAVSPTGRPGASPATAKQKAQRVAQSLITMGVPSARLRQSTRTATGAGPDRVLVYTM